LISDSERHYFLENKKYAPAVFWIVLDSFFVFRFSFFFLSPDISASLICKWKGAGYESPLSTRRSETYFVLPFQFGHSTAK
jgi:hypothetical protein